ncbi:MAG: carbohydrate binding family 9 domain-containing protein [Gemmatimonadetes bacterium]|nr:carbohydrate binding family 9 domain-containing protein [Gemmatimonadota bacterium]
MICTRLLAPMMFCFVSVALAQSTVVRFLSTGEGLWIGIHAYDREPGRVLHAQLRRDTEFDTDDAVQVMLSPLQDKRTAFLFSVNPNGAMTDAEVVSFESENLDWDAVWDSRAQITADGWVAEVFIPWQTLRYRERATAWDVNVRRVIRRKNEGCSGHGRQVRSLARADARPDDQRGLCAGRSGSSGDQFFTLSPVPA